MVRNTKIHSLFLTWHFVWLSAFILPTTMHAQVSRTSIQDTFKIGVAVTTRYLMELAKPAFSETNSKVKISSVVDQTGNVVDAVMTGKASVAITTRDLKDYEMKKSSTLLGNPIGYDGLVLVTSNSIPIKSITFEQIVSIWTGVYVNWKELGGPDLPIVVIGRAKTYDPIMLFADFMQLDTKAVEGGITYSKKGKEVWRYSVVPAPATDELALEILTNTPGSITYFPLQIFNNYKSDGKAIKAFEFNGTEASLKTIANGEYFIHRRLNVITNGKPEGASKLFVDFMLSHKGQQLIKTAGFLTLK